MWGGLTFTLEMHDGEARLEPRVWRAIVTSALARSDEGLVVCDADLGVLFASARAVHLLRRLGTGPERFLPEGIARVVRAHLADYHPRRLDRLAAVRGRAVLVHAAPLRGEPPAHAAVWLQEEQPPDVRLASALRDRGAIGPRGVALAHLVREGLSNREIARELDLRESTVKSYLHQLYRACGVRSRSGLLAALERWAR